jgi:polysaccharide deacetylase 2 family uncharacterized protein YibQ
VLLRGCLLGISLLTGVAFADQTRPAAIAIIIDDMGHNLALGQRALALPAQMTFAMLPYASHSPGLAQEANAANREVMLHMPMATLTDYRISGVSIITWGATSPSAQKKCAGS